MANRMMTATMMTAMKTQASPRRVARRARTPMVTMMRRTKSLARVARRAERAVLLLVDNSRSVSNNENKVVIYVIYDNNTIKLIYHHCRVRGVLYG